MLSNFIQDKHRYVFYPYNGHFFTIPVKPHLLFPTVSEILLLCSASCFSCSWGRSLTTFGMIQERTYTNQKQNIPCSIISAVGITEDQLLSLVLLCNCKQLFFSLDSQMKPDVNNDPDCAARHTQSVRGLSRWALARRQPGFASRCSKDAAKMHYICVLKADRKSEKSVLICVIFLRQGEA